MNLRFVAALAGTAMIVSAAAAPAQTTMAPTPNGCRNLGFLMRALD